MENKFNPLDWLAEQHASTAKNVQPKAEKVNINQSSGEAHPRCYCEDSKAELMAVISELLERRCNVAESYNDWWRIGCALAWELGPEGRDAYHQLSAMSQKYDPRECDRKWAECLRVSDGRTTRATIFWMAEQAGIDIDNLTVSEC